MRPTDRVDGYLPLAAYALIGDCRSSALVGEDGSVDWLCLPRFDDASLFGRILDRGRGGHWQIMPRAPYQVLQRYRDRTNVLQTTFATRTGRVILTDFMPLHEQHLGRHAAPGAHPRLVRVVECVGGEMTLHNDLVPAPDYGAQDASNFHIEDAHFHADSGEHHYCIVASEPFDDVCGTFHLTAGRSVAFALACDRAGGCRVPPITMDEARRIRRQTQEFWWRWIAGCRYDGPYQEPVWRSALALKLMTYSPTGAIIAAPTTSLPEALGAGRNWDYRFTWLRDASFTLYAFFQLGLTEEAHAFFEWLSESGIGRDGGPVDNLYTLDGTRAGVERTLDHLEGYRGSRPVRVGNAAAQQLQLDVYGELLDSAYLYARFGGRISRTLWRELHRIVELAIDRWQEPDASIWEVRGTNRHFTYSTMMCWVAVDRGLRLAERFDLPHDRDRWRSARRAMHRRVASEGWNESLGAFTQELGGDALDASLLRMSQVRLVRDHDPRLRSTIDAIARRLRDGDLVRRYRVDDSSDGLEGQEGAFLMCSFWLVDSLAHQGEVEHAQRLFDRLLTFGSPLDLFAEECDTRTGELLGNYPQAFTHLALVGAAVNIERARHRRLGRRGLTAAGAGAAHDSTRTRRTPGTETARRQGTTTP